MPWTAACVAALLVVRDADPGEEQQEGDVDADFRAEEPADRKGPGHRDCSSQAVDCSNADKCVGRSSMFNERQL